MRRKAKTISAPIEVKLERLCHNDQGAFLANERNKVQLINFLANDLETEGHLVQHAQGDADSMIAKTAITTAKTGKAVILLAEDTDKCHSCYATPSL